MRTALFCCLASAAILGAAHAEDAEPVAKGGQTYARHLAEAARKDRPEVLAVAIATESKGAPPAPVGSDPMGGASGAVARTPLVNVSGDRLGEIDITYAKAGDHAAASAAIQRFIARRVLSAKNLADPYPYDQVHSLATYAQRLVDQTLAAHPELLVFAIHATGPGEKTNVIIGSNIGRIGKAADEDDLRVIQQGSTNLEVAEGGKRFEVELPLNDARGARIGALGVVFAFKAGDDKDALHRRAIAIRDALARKISTSAALFKPQA